MIDIRKSKGTHSENKDRLRLNCVDNGLLALSGIGEYPHFHWILKIFGEIDSALLGRAIIITMYNHPNMATKIYTQNLRTFRRIETPSAQNVLNIIDLTNQENLEHRDTKALDRKYREILNDWINKPFDPSTDFPVRILLIKKMTAERSLVFSFDHSSIDGIRSLQFIRDVVRAYSNPSFPRPSSFDISRSGKPIELLEFMRRQRQQTSRFYLKMLSSLVHRFFIAPIRPPARIFHDKFEKSETVGYCIGTISPVELDRIRAKARAARVTLNDMFLAACFRTIDSWNNRHGKGNRKVTIMVPTDIGDETFSDMITNQVSYISLRTMPRDRANPIKLLYKVRRDMSEMLQNGISFSVIYCLHLFSFAPAAIGKSLAKFMMLTRVFVDTTVLSNLGVIWPQSWGEARLGGSRIADINLVMPVVTPMGLSLGASTYNNRLHICLSYKTAFFSEERAKSFLKHYLKELRRYPIAMGFDANRDDMEELVIRAKTQQEHSRHPVKELNPLH